MDAHVTISNKLLKCIVICCEILLIPLKVTTRVILKVNNYVGLDDRQYCTREHDRSLQ